MKILLQIYECLTCHTVFQTIKGPVECVYCGAKYVKENNEYGSDRDNAK